MRIYGVGAFFKICLGILILTILWNYVNVFETPAIGLGFGFLGVFITVRGIAYFIFLLCYKLFSTAPADVRTSASYKLSLFLGMYVMVNLTLMIIDQRTQFIGIIILIVFSILQIVFTYEQRKSY